MQEFNVMPVGTEDAGFPFGVGRCQARIVREVEEAGRLTLPVTVTFPAYRNIRNQLNLLQNNPFLAVQ